MISDTPTSSNGRNNNDILFYLIWRDHYVNRIIRNKICAGLVININLDYLNKNHQHLSILSTKENCIYIKLSIKDISEFYQYTNHPYRQVVNEISFSKRVDVSPILRLEQQQEKNQHQQQQQPSITNHLVVFDYNRIPEGVVRLSFCVDKNIQGGGRFPDSLTTLYLNSRDQSEFSSVALDRILSNLPNALTKLTLPRNYSITKECLLPLSLKDLEYTNRCSNLCKLVVPPLQNKVFKGCEAIVEKLEDLDWLQGQMWITNITIRQLSGSTIRQNLIPTHIRSLSLHYDTEVESGSLPEALESLSLDCTIPITRDMLPVNLYRLSIGSALPSSLKYLYLTDMSEKLVKDLLPPSLEILYLLNYDQPLDPMVLPGNLKELQLGSFDQELQMGSLPQSLQILHLDKFKQPLLPKLLPDRLQTLLMLRFNQTLEPHTLPKSLTSLQLFAYKGSFDHVCPLNRLTELTVYSFKQSIVPVISNAKILKLSFYNLFPNTTLQNTSIQQLYLNCIVGSQTLYPGFLPPTLRKLKTKKLIINSPDIVPDSCIYLSTDIQNLRQDIIPSSVKYIKFKKK